MGSISRYIFRTTFGAFLVALISLTLLIWVTQALRDGDIMTSQGQTVLVVIGITGLIIPLLVLVIAPIALLIAVAHTLNKMSTDSEIIVMNAAGMSPWLLFSDFMNVAIVVAIMLDDRRYPNELATVRADTGDLIDNANGSFLILQCGGVQRREPDRKD